MELDYLFPMWIIGIIDLAVMLGAMTLFITPFTCASKCYPDEPAPRIVQYGFPGASRLPFVMFVNSTVIQPQWYVSSISEYAGARGTTASKILTLATTCAGSFQFMLAICILQYGAYENIARCVLLSIGAFGCVLLGLAESALSWQYGRELQIRLIWNMLSPEERRRRLENALLTYEIMQRAANKCKGADEERKCNMIAGKAWLNVLKIKELDAKQQAEDEKVPFAVLDADSIAALLPESARNKPWKAVISLAAIEQYIVELERLLECSGTALLLAHDKNGASQIPATTVNVIVGGAQEEIEQQRERKASQVKEPHPMPVMPPMSYMKLEMYQEDVQELIISSGSGNASELILVNDTNEKSLYSNIHMISALTLMFSNFAAHIISLQELDINPARYASFVSAIVGMTAFIFFCLLQFLSGNYDSSLPFPASWMPFITTAKTTCCLHCFHCPQMIPSSYGRFTRKQIALVFIAIELVAFLSMMMSTPLEALLLTYV